MLSDEAKIIRFKNQRNNMEIKLNEKVDELQKLNENYIQSCHERNKCEILIEKKNNFRMEEYKKYKEFYNNYVPYTDELQKLLIKKQ